MDAHRRHVMEDGHVSTPPATPIKVTSGYHATGALPQVDPAALTAEAFPGSLPKAIGYIKDIGNMNTSKASALDGLDAARTFRATGSVEQAVVAASLLAQKLPRGAGHHSETNGATSSYAVLASGDALYVTPLWMKNPDSRGERIGFDVDWRGPDNGANYGRGTAAKATDPMFVAAVGQTRWIDTRGTVAS
jgi:hypothetical protein